AHHDLDERRPSGGSDVPLGPRSDQGPTRRSPHRTAAVGPDRTGEGRLMRLILWHVHGSWTTALVQGRHEYLVPVLPDRGPNGRGRAQTWEWPSSVVEVTPEEAAHAEVDVVLLQRPEELHELAERWLGGRRPG